MNDSVIIEFIKILLPAAAVLYAMYLTVKSFLNKDIAERMADLKVKGAETTLPIRLQAYERLSLLLERIAPNNLILRLNDSNYSAKEFQHVLTTSVREEYNHNLSQQIYVGDQAWQLTTQAVEDIIATVNQAADTLPAEARSLDLAKKTLEIQSQKEVNPIAQALFEVKKEVRALF
ncbi:hypothetical protein [Tunicatimonas pelagia]|uniref:DUF7935 family protein n=1 Tax=Tunicatimonas pelagia TaxID=931531 RepID=UPI00266656DF|nr:hypothetical protein [Tunicatimonas pelagia]WKN45975.1 hypothetical protein P0M28_13510 [Tunicatimonas pelagia]